MTRQEIQALIDAKIAGQGNQVDLAGALPEILNEIVEMASEAKPQEQADYTQTNEDEVDFIKNKPVALVTMPSNNYVVVDSIDAYQDVNEMRVGNDVFFRNDIFAKHLRDVSIEANIGGTITGTGAVFVRIQGRNMNESSAGYYVQGVAVVALNPDPNPSAPPFCLTRFSTYLGTL